MYELLKLINSHLRHDILNDLTTVRSILEVYKDARNDELLENALQKIDGSANFLKEMKEVESMVSEGELKPLKLCDALKPIHDKYKEVNFNVKGDCRVMADDSLTSVFDNLVRNAVTHGDADRVDVKVLDKGDVCQVEIADNGEGIPDDIRGRVFEEGVSTDGTGLGLYIVKKTIERYGGSIHLKDNQQGTTFTMIFKTPVTQKQESRDSGMEVLGDIGWGTHICHFYQTKDDLTEVLIPYFKAGLKNNEYCLWITSDYSKKDAQRLVKDQLQGIEIISYDQWYTDDTQQILKHWSEKLNQVLADGYDGLRVAGDTAWLGSLKKLNKYEEEIQEAIEGKKVIALCCYPFNRLKTSEIADLTSRHHYTLVVREGEWEYIENFEYRRTQNILQKIEDKYRALVENANEGVVVVQDAMIVYVNSRVMEFSGYSQEEIMFKPFHEFIHPEDREFVFKRYKERVNSAGTDTYQFRFINKMGGTRWAEIKVTSIEWDGKPATLNLLTDITAQKEAKERLQKLKKSYQELFDKSGDAIFIHDPDTAEILDVNQKMCELYGYTREEALNLKVGDLSGGNYTNERAKELVQKARTEGQQTFEWQGKKKDGTIFWKEVTLKNAVIGGKERVLASVHDITERKKSEQALKESEEKYRTYVDNSPVAIFVANAKGDYVDVNNAACEMLDYTKEELLNMSIPQVAEDNDNSLKGFEQLKSLGNYRGERRLKRKDGSLINVDLNAVALENGGFIAFCSDITEKRMAQKRLKESEVRYRNLFNHSNYAILIHDLEGKIVDANQKSLELTGYSKSEMLSLNVMDLAPLESIETVGQKFNKISRDGFVNFEIDYLTKDDEVRTVEISASTFDSGGKSLVQSLVRDITDKKRYELALKESEERYRQLVDNVMDIPYTLDIDGVITYVGPQVEQYGYNAQEIVGRDFTEIIHPEDVGQVRYNLQRSLETGEELPSEFRIHTPAMGLRWFEERGGLVKGGEGEVRRVSGILRDVTERRQAEEHVEHLNSLLMAIRNVNQLIVQEQDFDKLLNGTCRLLLEIRGYLGCSIALLKEDNAIVPVARAGAGEPQFLNYKDLSVRAGENTPECVKAVIETGELYIVNNRVCERCAYREQAHGNFCTLIIPMKENSQIVGLFFVILDKDIEISEDEIGLLQEVADDLVFARSKFKAEERLKESETRYRATFEHTGTAMIVIDEDTTISKANKECEKLSGYSKEEIEGNKKWTEFVHPDDLERMLNYHSKRRKGEEIPNKYEFRLVDKEGIFKDVFITIDLIPGTREAVASLLDITYLRRLNRLLEVISEINEVVARIKNPEIVLDAVCKNLKLLYEDISACVIRNGEPVPVKSEGASIEAIKNVVSKCPSVRSALEGQSMKISTDSELCQRCIEKLHKFALSIPLIHEEQRGIITIHSNSDFSDEEFNLLRKLASNIAFALSAYEVEQDKVTAMEQLAQNLAQFDMAADRLRNPLAVIMSALELKEKYGESKTLKIIQEQTDRIKDELDELRRQESATHELIEQSKR